MTTRRDFIKYLTTGAVSIAIAPRLVSSRAFGLVLSEEDPWSGMPSVLARIKPPAFPKRDFLITKFGAKGDRLTTCTAAFQKAIATCSKAGGGRVVVPEGTFLTGAIHLTSNVNLVVSRGATIKFSKDPGDYLPVVFSRWEGTELMNYSPFIYALGQQNIAITGEGTLDGQSGTDSWWPWNGRANYGWKEGTPNQRSDR